MQTAAVETGRAPSLHNLIENKLEFTQRKEARIQKIKNQLELQTLSLPQIYNINRSLYREYRKFQTDSALLYTLQNQKIAENLQNADLLHEVEIQLANLYAMRGMYIEARTILDALQVAQLPKTLLPDYYETCENFCSSYGQSTGEQKYYMQSEHYRDLLLSVLDTASFVYKIKCAAKNLYSYQPC
ncbi:hypothetical protein FACS189429_7130 [Bacteroidia bacterium]|nr:hypothetical protein FACS189429_7130 [Bacteroidia bacterium]